MIHLPAVPIITTFPILYFSAVPDPLELSKMYPTPPSMENIPSDGHSPQTSAEPLCETTIMDSVYVKMEVQPTIMSQDPSKVWSPIAA